MPMFVTGEDGVLCIRLDKAVHPLLAFRDELPLRQWEGDKTLYIAVDDAIEWHKKQSENPEWDGREILAALHKSKVVPKGGYYQMPKGWKPDGIFVIEGVMV